MLKGLAVKETQNGLTPSFSLPYGCRYSQRHSLPLTTNRPGAA